MEFISVVEIIGTVAFAISGALAAIDKELDYYGIAILSIVTAVGGGIIRDILIDISLPASLENPAYIIVSLISAAIVIIFYRKIVHYTNLLQYFDALGLAAFTALGAEVAVLHNFRQPFVVITLAVMTGTGGGTLRDVFAKEIPFVFRKEVYALASIIGSIVFISTYNLLGSKPALYLCFVITLIIRLVCMKKNIQLKKVIKTSEPLNL